MEEECTWQFTLNTSLQKELLDQYVNCSLNSSQLPLKQIYLGICIPVIIFCLISVIANLVILSSYFWISRSSISRTLQITMSLVVADLCTFVFDSMSLTVNSLLPVAFEISDPLSLCTRLLLEALRMGGKMTTLGHLLALALIHYQGIKRPFQYRSPMRCRTICFIALLLWILPSALLITYFSVIDGDGFSTPGCAAKFLSKYDFRSKVSLVFFGTVIGMSLVYFRIYRLVHESQTYRARYMNAGAQGGAEQRRTEKALYTTLLIVGSTVLGWLPASLTFFLVCDDCIFISKASPDITMIIVYTTCNCLLILKTACNSYIYAMRMSGIRAALRKMWMSLKRVCCRLGNGDVSSLSDSRHHSRTSTRRSQRTVHCRIQSLARHDSSRSTQL